VIDAVEEVLSDQKTELSFLPNGIEMPSQFVDHAVEIVAELDRLVRQLRRVETAGMNGRHFGPAAEAGRRG
jgi:hypothetical protein